MRNDASKMRRPLKVRQAVIAGFCTIPVYCVIFATTAQASFGEVLGMAAFLVALMLLFWGGVVMLNRWWMRDQ
ncbi:hypothetical protein ABMA10_19380 [Plantibacter sp. RU18]